VPLDPLTVQHGTDCTGSGEALQPSPPSRWKRALPRGVADDDVAPFADRKNDAKSRQALTVRQREVPEAISRFVSLSPRQRDWRGGADAG
jgi:hypothetical protein